MKPLIAALLLACLAVPPGAGWPGAARAQGSGDEDPGVPSGPVTRRPPPRAVEVQPEPDAPEAAGVPAGTPAAAAPEEPGVPVVEVLDASVFEGVFAPYTVRDGREIPEALSGEPGDPVAGRRLYHNSSRTGCSLCHDTAEAPRRPESDRTAPPLYRVAERLTPGRLRLWIVAPQTIRPDTGMPAFHKPGQRTEPWDPLYGGPRLTASEIEDVVAYLSRAGMPKAGD